jgi:hypothetical protein
MLYSEYQGIRMTLIGAQRFGETAFMYVSLQDVSGENRLSDPRHTGMYPFFSIGTISTGDGLANIHQTKTLLDFDENTNTAYYALSFSTVGDLILAHDLELMLPYLELNTNWYHLAPVDMCFTNVGEAETIPVAPYFFRRVVIGNTIHGVEAENPPQETMATGGWVAPLPHGVESQWISNIGIVGDFLRIQVNEYNNTNAGLGWFSLIGPDGEIIEAYGVGTLDGDVGVVGYEEFFCLSDIEDLTAYTLVFSGVSRDYIPGRWHVTAYAIHETGEDTITLNDGGWTVTLNPVAVRVSGARQLGVSARVRLILETEDGYIDFGEHWWNDADCRIFYSQTPIDVAAITAVIVNDLRIPISN